MPAKKPAKKSAKTKALAKALAEPTAAMTDAVVDLTDTANDLIIALDEAAAADDVGAYHDAVGEAATQLARLMRGMAALAAKLDPGALAAAEAKAKALPAARAPALPQ
jgi:inactivated superfamily I helicase